MLAIIWTFLRGGFSRALGIVTTPVHLPFGAWLLPAVAAIWFWHAHSVTEHKLEACHAARKADQQAWANSVAAAKTATAAAQQKGKESADEAQTLHDQLAASQRSLRDYAAVHRRVQPVASTADAASTSSGDAASVPADAATVPTVEVPESVLNVADADYTYAESCYAFGQSLIQKGLTASPPKGD